MNNPAFSFVFSVYVFRDFKHKFPSITVSMTVRECNLCYTSALDFKTLVGMQNTLCLSASLRLRAKIMKNRVSKTTRSDKFLQCLRGHIHKCKEKLRTLHEKFCCQ